MIHKIKVNFNPANCYTHMTTTTTGVALKDTETDKAYIKVDGGVFVLYMINDTTGDKREIYHIPTASVSYIEHFYE